MQANKSRRTGEMIVKMTKQEHLEIVRVADSLRTLAKFRDDPVDSDADNMLADGVERVARDFKPKERGPETKPIFDESGEAVDGKKKRETAGAK
jgi:hypothetical protein